MQVADALLEHEVLDAPQLHQLLSGQPIEARLPAAPSPAPVVPPREGRVEEGERKGGILPPPMAAPKPTA